VPENDAREESEPSPVWLFNWRFEPGVYLAFQITRWLSQNEKVGNNYKKKFLNRSRKNIQYVMAFD